MRAKHICSHIGCGAQYTRNDMLLIHERSHTGENPYACDHPGCGATFAVKRYLKWHSRVHTGVLPYACNSPGCDAKFSHHESLATHKRVEHLKEKTCVCNHPGCDAKFYSSSDLSQHKRYHAGVKRYACDHPGCDKTFMTSGKRIEHMYSHTKDQPYPCDYPGCDVRCLSPWKLKLHKRSHTGEKPFACDFPGCQRKFTASGDLVNHKRLHSGEKPFACDYPGCEARFSAANRRAQHKQIHSENWQQKQKRAEQYVANMLEKAGIAYKREHVIDFACVTDDVVQPNKYARVDFLIILHGVVIIVEVDEGQHRFGSYSVSCDMSRMARIIESLCVEGNTLPVWFIRYNPNAYTLDGVKQKSLKKTRVERLIEQIQGIHGTPRQPLTITYMYYDCETWDDNDHRLCIHTDPGYNAQMIACCTAPIV